jgi:hypothetical protein
MVVTDKARAYLALAQVRDRWHEFSDDQRTEVAELIVRLNQAMRRENVPPAGHSRPLPLAERSGVNHSTSRPQPLLGRIAS